VTESDNSPASAASRPTELLSRIPPWLTLLLLAPILGELVSGHQTPLEFINPLNLAMLSLPYGCGALICRELAVRWGGGPFCLLLLGIAYGVYEEGIVVYSLFDPLWSELGPMAGQGYYAGVNWTWAAGTVQFHALVSIGSSVSLAQMIHADRRSEPWLGIKGWVVCAAVLVAWIPVLGMIMHTSMKRAFPPWHLYALAWVAVGGLARAAYRLARRPRLPIERAPEPPWAFFVLGCINVSLLFIAVFVLPNYSAPPLALTMVFLVLLDGVSLWLLWKWSGRGQTWDDRHRLALVAGILTFFVLFSFAKDAESWHGCSIVGALTILGLWQLAGGVRDRLKAA